MKIGSIIRLACFHASIRLSCHLTPVEVADALRAVTDPKPHYSLFDPYLGDFRGDVQDNGFQVRWVPYGLWKHGMINMVLFIAGDFQATTEGCTIDIVVRRNLTLFWIPIAVALFMLALILFPDGRNTPRYGPIVALVIIIAGLTWLLGAINFRVGLRQLKTRLSQLWCSRTIG